MTLKRASKLEKKTRAGRIKGICAAAQSLRVTRAHLWAVLTGRRESKPLLARYHQLKKTSPASASASKGAYLNSPKRLPPDISTAAAENLTPEFFAILDTLGVNLLIVRFEAGRGSPIWEHVGIESELERELRAVHAGQFDSSFFTLGAQFHFFHVTDLGKAMQQLKASLERRGLLAITTIMHAESADDLRVYWPPTAELVETSDAADA